MDTYGKKFEEKLKGDWMKVPNAYITRLKDSMSGYKTIKNECDFIGYMFPFIYYIEAKTTKENTFNFSKLTQYGDLKDISEKNIYGMNLGVVIFFYNRHEVCYVPIEECVRIKEILGKKSIHYKMIDDSDYKVYRIPSKLKRVFMDSDYSIMQDIAKEKYNDYKEKLK